MNLKIKSITLENFRAFRSLQIAGLGRVNLITGKNNTGKSSILEALRILTSDAAPSVILGILKYREEDGFDFEDDGATAESNSITVLSSFFHGFPQLTENPESIVITTNGDGKTMNIRLGVSWFTEERDAQGNRLYRPQQTDLFGEGEGESVLEVQSNGGIRRLSLEAFRKNLYRNRLLRPENRDEPSLPCLVVSPYGGEKTATLGVLWDRIALSDPEKDVVDALKIIDPQISAVSMVGGESPRRSRTAIVKADNIARPVPLRSYGDGLNRLFGIILSLVNAKDGLLLIDEFENGMHHSVQLDAWRIVFRLAQKLNIQVFATSHSWDSIEAFQKASAETPEDGVLVRLARMGEDVIPTVFREDELAVATRDGIEVR